MLKINYPLLDLLSQSTDSILYRNSTRWTSFTSTALGRSLVGSASEAAARTLINAARTDGANMFSGDQIAGSGYGFRSAFFTDPTQAYTYLALGVDSTHAAQIYNLTSSRTALTITGASGQSRPLLELQTSLGAVTGSWGATGDITSIGNMLFGADSGVIQHELRGALTLFKMGSLYTGSIDTSGWAVRAGSQYLFSSLGWSYGTPDLGLARDSAGVLRVSDGSTGLGSLITSTVSASQLVVTTENIATLAYNRLFFNNGGNTNPIIQVNNVNSGYALKFRTQNGDVFNIGGPGDCSFTTFNSSKTPVTINLASGQTAAALSVLDSLGASKFFVANDGAAKANYFYTLPSGGTLQYFGGAGGPSTFIQPQNAAYTALTIAGYASQTAPLQTWQLVSSTGATQVAADTYSWTNSTHATRTPRIVRSITDYGAERTYMQVDANGTAVTINHQAGVHNWKDGNGNITAHMNCAGASSTFYATYTQADVYLFAPDAYSNTLKASTNTRLSYLDLSSGAKFVCTGSTDIGLGINLASGQTANAFEVRDSLSAVLASFNAGCTVLTMPTNFAIGLSASASGVNATACGGLASATGSYASAFGRQSNASGNYSVALGPFAYVYPTSTYGVALGRYAFSGNPYSCAIGNGATTSESNTFAVNATGSASTGTSFQIQGMPNVGTDYAGYPMANLATSWVSDVLASRVARLTLNTYYISTAQEAIRIDAASDQARVAIGGAVIASTRATIYAGVATDVALAVVGATSQSANLQECRNSAGTVLTAFDSAGKLLLPNANNCIYNEFGNLYLNTAGILKLAAGSGVSVFGAGSAVVPLTLNLASGQTANGIEQRTSLGAVNFNVTPAGWVNIGNGSTAYPLSITNASATGMRIQVVGSSVGSPAFDFVDTTNGVETIIAASGANAVFGTFSNHPVRLLTNQVARLLLDTAGDVECLTATKGFVLQSPDNTRWRITVSDAGVVSATAL